MDAQDLALDFGAAILGLFFGLSIWGRLVRWVYTIWNAYSERHRESHKRWTPWGIAALLVLSSAPWLIIATGIFTFYILKTQHQQGWLWFFSGALLAPMPAALMVLRFLHRRRRSVT